MQVVLDVFAHLGIPIAHDELEGLGLTRSTVCEATY